MRWLLFLSRVAFICNVFFLLSWLLRYVNYVHDQAAASTIIISGYFLALIFNPLVNISYLMVLLLRRRQLTTIVPLWLALANFIFLLLQLQFILFLNTSHD